MQCLNIPQVSSVEFFDRLYPLIISKRIPLQGSFELTLRCNLSCKHCYCRQSLNNRELALPAIKNFFDEIAEKGCLWLLLTGGEPLLRDDFIDIYAYAKKKGFLITLFTNATLIDEKLADYFSSYPPHAIEVSLYGITPVVYETVTGLSGSFDACMRGIKLMLDRKLPLQLKTMALTLNKQELKAIEDFADSLGVSFRIDPEINCRLDGDKGPYQYRLSVQEVILLDTASEKRKNQWQQFISRFGDYSRSDKLFICNAGLNSFHLDPYGNVSPCMMVRKPGYNLSDYSFSHIWEKCIPAVINQKPPLGYVCAQCQLQILCSQCPGWSQWEEGNFFTPIEYICRIARLRAKEFGLEQKQRCNV